MLLTRDGTTVGLGGALAPMTLLRPPAGTQLSIRSGARNFPTGGLTLPTRGLNYGFQSIVNAKNLGHTSFSPSFSG